MSTKDGSVRSLHRRIQWRNVTLMTASTVSCAFSAGIFRFTLTAREVLFVPARTKTNMLRGGFGYSFRSLCCIPECVAARACPLEMCPYKAIFEPCPPPGAAQLTRNQDVQRPFIFRAPDNEKTKFQPGEPLEFILVLIGHALNYLPHFVLSFRELAEKGMGVNRARCELKQVEEEDGLECEGSWNGGFGRTPAATDSGRLRIYSSGDRVFHNPRAINLEKVIARRMEQLAMRQQIRIQFLTPVHIRAENRVIRKPDFSHVLKRVRDRISALSAFFGSGPLDADFAGLGRRAEQVRTLSCNVRWEEHFRTSSRTQQVHELSGFVGEAVYEGELNEFLPWLIVGELVHVGKHTAWGMGSFRTS